MELTDDQLSDIRLLLRRYWNGDRTIERYKITEDVRFTVDHTEDDEVVFAVSIADVRTLPNDSFESDTIPEHLEDFDTFNEIQSQVERLVRGSITSNTEITLYREPTVPFPMAQYIGTVDLKSVR